MRLLHGKFKILIPVILMAISLAAFKILDNNFEISKNLDIFATLYKELNASYVDDINPGEFMKTGIDAMLQTLDPYTIFIPESEIEDYKIATTGQYGGIGASIFMRDSIIVIAEPYEGFPAQKGGLLAGDILLEINNQSTKGKSVDDISKVLNGQQGTELKILIQRTGSSKLIEKTLIRENIKINNIPYFGMISDGVAYVKLSGFTQDATMEVKRSLLKLKEENTLTGLVLDLRGNGGGLLLEAVNICNLFMQRGELIVSTRGKIKEKNIFYRTSGSPLDLNIPIIILVDKNSASASEIVSGAMQDLDRAVIIGQRTYGKGLVQNILPLSYNAQLKVTIAKYYIPSGRCIQAIDYAHKDEEGNFLKVPDSLINEFKTKIGRPVFDGGGIEPDINMEPRKLNKITKSLLEKFIIFDYASQYHLEHPSIDAPEDFVITDEIYNDFINYIKDKDYDYTTKSELSMEAFKQNAQEENYFEALQTEYEALKKKMMHDKDHDLIKFRNEIIQLLRSEIVARYYYKTGKIKVNLADDPEIKKAIAVLKDKELYHSILNRSDLNNQSPK